MSVFWRDNRYYWNVSEANVTRLILDIHIKTWEACNVELSNKTKVENDIAAVYKTIKSFDNLKLRICSQIFDDMKRLNTHMITVHDSAPAPPPNIGKIVGIWKITGGRR